MPEVEGGKEVERERREGGSEELTFLLIQSTETLSVVEHQ